VAVAPPAVEPAVDEMPASVELLDELPNTGTDPAVFAWFGVAVVALGVVALRLPSRR
jgi:LPXTG-motif cell wall-anchored protein